MFDILKSIYGALTWSDTYMYREYKIIDSDFYHTTSVQMGSE